MYSSYSITDFDTTASVVNTLRYIAMWTLAVLNLRRENNYVHVSGSANIQSLPGSNTTIIIMVANCYHDTFWA